MSASDERVLAGMREQLAARRERLSAGERPLGWKLGFGTAAAMDTLGTDRPLVGFLTHGRLLAEGATVDVSAWAAPVLEPEIAVHLARDIAGDASADDAAAAVGALSAAIELADLDPPPTDVRAILAGDIYHRHVLLGPPVARTDPAGIRAVVTRDGEEIAATDDATALTGSVGEILRLTAETLAACGEALRAGDVVITGSVVPGIAARGGRALRRRARRARSGDGRPDGVSRTYSTFCSH